MASRFAVRWLPALLLTIVAAQAPAAMQALADEELEAVTGQAGSLFLADKITPNELANPDPGGASAFTFYRMGMDVKMDMNLNIDKLQLGCGGVNDFLTATQGCDIDLDYVGFMGLNAAKDRPATNGPDSLFTLTRPYIEIAVKNDSTPATREVVGIKIGAQRINGAIRIGRDYLGVGGFGQESSLTNREHGTTCNPSATTGAGVIACHSGINSISGALPGLELSAGFRARATICDPLLFCVWPFYPSITANIDGCIGTIAFDPCTNNADNDTPFFIDAGGTRLNSLYVAAAALKMQADVTLGINLTGYGSLILDTRQIHYLLAPDSSDFALSFQRERVAWPRYEKAPPTYPRVFNASRGVGTTHSFNSCDPQYGQVPTNGRCGSAYSEPASTGWWLQAANMKVLNLQPGNQIVLPGSYTLFELLTALGPDTSPIIIDNPRLDFVAARNCYGAQMFC